MLLFYNKNQREMQLLCNTKTRLLCKPKTPIAAVVVAYYPDGSIVDNINSYIDFVNVVYFFKNSTIEPCIVDELLKCFGSKIKFIGDEVNVGLGEAINVAAELSENNSFRYLLTMDQDSSFVQSKGLSSFFSLDLFAENTLLISPNHQIKNKNEFEVDCEPLWVMTSGNIIDLQVLSQIGGLATDLFIDGVDIELCMRAKSFGKTFAVDHECKLKHKLGDTSINYFLGKSFTPTHHSPLRYYYIFRNYLYLTFKADSSSYCYKKSLLKALLLYFVNVTFFESHKRKKLLSMIAGARDFLMKKKGQKEY